MSPKEIPLATERSPCESNAMTSPTWHSEAGFADREAKGNVHEKESIASVTESSFSWTPSAASRALAVAELVSNILSYLDADSG